MAEAESFFSGRAVAKLATITMSPAGILSATPRRFPRREDNRRRATGEQVTCGSAVEGRLSLDFCGSWQRRKVPKEAPDRNGAILSNPLLAHG
ncbi:MAG TPA: hypothetical protein VJR47_17230 [Stellaceae bacterium]|nr:hypothetical protein [Stellaceae bacterium]